MLRRLALRDFAIVAVLEVEFDGGFTVLSGETGAGKSILVDALQLVLGARGDVGVVREGAARAEVSAEFEALPPVALSWLEEAGFDTAEPLLLRRTVDAQGKSRAWIAGSAATVAQLKALGEWLVDIHGQHAWQSLARAAAVRALLDAYAGVDTAPMTAAWSHWREAQATLDKARSQATSLEQERERLAWQLGELDKLAPGRDEWDELNAEHQRLAHAQAIRDGVQGAIDALADADRSAVSQTDRAIDALQAVADFDATLAGALEVLQGAQAQLTDATHTLRAALRHTGLDPERLAELDERLGAWIGLARRWRRQPQELPATLTAWRTELAALDAAADLDGLARQADATERSFRDAARKVSTQRRQGAPRLARSVADAMQSLGMAGGRFEVSLLPLPEPQAQGLEAVEFLVAGHAGSTPRPLGKVASGGELSRIALAVAVTTSALGEAGTLIFDEVDAGVGGAVAETVGRLMQRLGHDRQVLAVTHLPQVAACADAQLVVSKQVNAQAGVRSAVAPVSGEARTAEIARMLGGGASEASLAHAREMLGRSLPAANEPTPPSEGRTGRARR
ncbi:MAG: DNA repair protein RecN [Burkholderiales bacterium]